MVPTRAEVVAQPTKQGWLYVFDRTNGQPVWPIEERPVPKSDTPGERTSPTQPFPTKPAAFDRQGITLDDLIDFTPELRADAVKAVAPFRLGASPFTPPSMRMVVPVMKEAPSESRKTMAALTSAQLAQLDPLLRDRQALGFVHDGHGDLHVRVNVEVPTHLNSAQKAKLQEFSDLCSAKENPISHSFFEKAKRLFR